MAKYKSPFNSGEVFISQTYHSGSNNTAVDFGSRAVGTAVYAIANGVIQTVSPSYGSYLTLNVDNSDHVLFYVHIYNFTVKAGDRVSIGQKIGEIAPQSVNGNVPPHLHLGLQTGFGIMDYFDRNIVFRTKYQAIKDIWFIGENLNWGLFRDLSYENTSMFKIGDRIEFTGTQTKRGAPAGSDIGGSQIGMLGTIKDGPRTATYEGVSYQWWDIQPDNEASGWFAWVNKWKIYTPPVEPPADPQPTEYQKEVMRLEGVVRGLEDTVKARETTIQSQSDKIKSLKAEILEEKSNSEKLQIMFDGLQGSYDILEGEKLDLQEELSKCKLDLEQGQDNFIKKILDAIKGWLDSIKG